MAAGDVAAAAAAVHPPAAVVAPPPAVAVCARNQLWSHALQNVDLVDFAVQICAHQTNCVLQLKNIGHTLLPLPVDPSLCQWL